MKTSVKQDKRANFMFSPLYFSLLSEMVVLNMQTVQMLMSSGEVIAHRINLMHQVMNGKAVWSDREFVKMWEEKISANVEACNSFYKSMQKLSYMPGGNIEEFLTTYVRAVTESTRPYHTKATSNAKRLRKK